jgi:transposase
VLEKTETELRAWLAHIETCVTAEDFELIAAMMEKLLRDRARKQNSEKRSKLFRGSNGKRGASHPDQRRRGHGRNSADAYTGAERVNVPLEGLTKGATCPDCKRGKLHDCAPSPVLRIIGEAPLATTIYECQRLRCGSCGAVYTANAPPEAGDDKYDASAAAMLTLLRYGMGVPLHRLEQLQRSLGIPLPASTQWEVAAKRAEMLVPVHRELVHRAAQGELVHNDDTGMKVLSLRGEIEASSNKDERTGIFTSGVISVTEDQHQIALFFTGRQHAGENLTDLLEQRHENLEPPIQMCDALTRNLPKALKVILANCLAHARRRFVEISNDFPVECTHLIEELAIIYRNDAATRGSSPDQRLAYHQAHSKPVMDRLEHWLDAQLHEKRVEPNSRLGGAIAYMQNHWQQFTTFLRVPGVPLDNNVCERALKMVICHRKNSLFYRTERGAEVGDLFMSLIHTARLAGANVFHYLTSLIKHTTDAAANPSRWLPWNYRAALDDLTASR